MIIRLAPAPTAQETSGEGAVVVPGKGPVRMADASDADLEALEAAHRPESIPASDDEHLIRPCPTCSASPGEPCKTITGQEMGMVHRDRRGVRRG